MYTHCLTLALAITLAPPAFASIILAQENFATYTGAGLAPGGANGMLDSNIWSVTGASDGPAPFGASRAQGDLARGVSPGGERGGGLYAFALPGRLFAVGVQATGSDFTPGALTYRFTNETGAGLSQLTADFDFWVLNDGARATRTTVEASTSGIRWLVLPALALDSPLTADTAGWQASAVSAPLPGITLAAGDSLLLRWTFDDLSGSGARDELALAGLRLTAAPDNPVLELPAPGAACLALTGLVLVRCAGRRKTIDFSQRGRLYLHPPRRPQVAHGAYGSRQHARI